MQRILILGAGFAGLWAAVGAVRKLSQSNGMGNQIEVLVVNNRPFHSVRVRNYEQNLASTRVPLADVLDPIGVNWLEAEILDVDIDRREVKVRSYDEVKVIPYARLVVALGSQLVHPNIPGLAAYSFDVDTIEGAEKLQRHLLNLPSFASDEAVTLP